MCIESYRKGREAETLEETVFSCIGGSVEMSSASRRRGEEVESRKLCAAKVDKQVVSGAKFVG